MHGNKKEHKLLENPSVSWKHFNNMRNLNKL